MMKKTKLFLVGLALIFSSAVFSSGSGVYTIYNDSTAPCYKKCCPMLGIYFDINVGYTWLNLSPYRLGDFNTLPLGIDDVEESTDSFITALGFDFYPCSHIPLRLELNYFYADADFKINPLFANTDEGFFSKDRFLVRNTMATLYIDWHTCTRFVPYAGVSAGFVSLQTYHHPDSVNDSLPFIYKAKETNFSWGATLGSRYFFSNSIFANLQFRFSNLGNVTFNDFTPEVISPFPELSNFKSDYLHESSIMFGLGYVF